MLKMGGVAGSQFGLRTKFIILIGLLLLMSGGSLGWLSFSRTKDSLEEDLVRRGLSLTKNLAHNSTFGVSIEDTGNLMGFVEGVVDEQDIAYVIVMSRDGEVLAHSNESEIEKTFSDELTKNALLASEASAVKTFSAGGEALYDLTAPVFSNSSGDDLFGEGLGSSEGRIGAVRVGISLKSLEARLSDLINVSIFVTILVVILGVLVSVFFIRMILGPIEYMAGAAVKMAEGDFTQKIQVTSRDELGVLGETFGKMSGGLSDMIKRVQIVAENVTMASEQLNSSSRQMHDGAQIQAASTESAGASIAQMNTSIKEIAEGIEDLSSSSEETSSSILEMSSSISEVAANAAGLAKADEDTSSSIMEMSASIKQVAENVNVLSSASDETVSAVAQINSTIREVGANAKEAAGLSGQVSQDAQELGVRSVEKTIEGMNKIKETVKKTVDVIDRLGERSEQIGKILTVIDEVTKKTNLLALNAAILAAQAGEQGKGFSVVADEIKNLADRTGSSTKEISQLIMNVQREAKEAVASVREGSKRVEEGVKLSLEAKEALQSILKRAQQSTVMAQEIEKATVEETRGMNQITDAMQRISTMVQQISRATQEQSRGGEQIMRASEKMRDMTRQVKTSTEEQAKGSRQITGAMENVTKRVQGISKAIHEQRRQSDLIIHSVEEIRTVAKDSVLTVGTMGKLIEDLSRQSADLKQSIGRFRVNQ